jgi:hypothetical protein
MKIRGTIVILVGGIFLAVVLTSVIHHYRLRSATEAYIRELKAKGEPMELSQVSLPSVPAEQNGAEIFRKAIVLHKADTNFYSGYFSMRMVAPGRAMVCAEQPDVRDSLVTNSWAEVEAAVDRNAELFATLQQIIEKPNFDFHIPYDKGIDRLDFPGLQLAETKGAALQLQAAVLCDLHRGDTAAAVKNQRATLAIAQGMRDEHLVISELVRIAISAIAVPGTWEILQSPNVTDGQLAALQDDWAKLEFIHSMETAFELERADGIKTVRRWRNVGSDFASQALYVTALSMPNPSTWDRLRMKSDNFLWQYWWSYSDELRSLKGQETLLEAARAAQTNDALLAIQTQLQANMAVISTTTNINNAFGSSDPMAKEIEFALSDSVQSLAKSFSRMIKMEAAKRIVVTAIALKRYQLKHGKYPASLAALVPEFLPAVPRDAMDGQPLRYRLNTDGSFVLYSIGDDGRDDGGDPSTTGANWRSLYWQFSRDWVWPQPATAEEIQNFNDHPPK